MVMGGLAASLKMIEKFSSFKYSCLFFILWNNGNSSIVKFRRIIAVVFYALWLETRIIFAVIMLILCSRNDLFASSGPLCRLDQCLLFCGGAQKIKESVVGKNFENIFCLFSCHIKQQIEEDWFEFSKKVDVLLEKKKRNFLKKS